MSAALPPADGSPVGLDVGGGIGAARLSEGGLLVGPGGGGDESAPLRPAGGSLVGPGGVDARAALPPAGGSLVGPGGVDARAALPPAGNSLVGPGGGMSGSLPCASCLRRAWLLSELAGRIEMARHDGRLPLLLALDDAGLMLAVSAPDEVEEAYDRFQPAVALATLERAGLTAICRHDARYPVVLAQLPDAPAVLHVAGDMERFVALGRGDGPAVAVVGARRASGYGLEVARALGRGLAVADVPVVSGMALGIDSAAHVGALEGGGETIAVLASGAERAYPPSKGRLYREIRARGVIVSEMPPGTATHRWCFPARNRLIAALAGLTVVVEAMERSGSLITAEFARDLGRDVGAVPGPVTAPLARGPNALLVDGAHVIRGPEDALDLACGVGTWERRGAARTAVPAHLRALYAAVASGVGTPDALADRGMVLTDVLTGLAELELGGHVRRVVGGAYLATLGEGA
jgi:DNA processing protein